MEILSACHHVDNVKVREAKDKNQDSAAMKVDGITLTVTANTPTATQQKTQQKMQHSDVPRNYQTIGYMPLKIYCI